MSEESNLNVNNLSITEEAFELFQASSMYSEDDYVVPGSTVSPQSIAVNVTKDLNEMSSENDIVSSTITEDQTQLTYCNLEVGCEVNIGEEDSTEQSNASNADSNCTNETGYLVTENREVHKDVGSVLNVEYSNNIEVDEPMELETVSNSEVYQPPTLSSSKRGKSRGRGRGRGRGRPRGKPRGSAKKQVNNITTTNTEFDIDVSDIAHLTSETNFDNTLETPNRDSQLLPTKDNNLLETPVQSSDNLVEEIPTVRRRGRRKKVTPPVTSKLQSSDGDTSPTLSRKRGRPRKGVFTLKEAIDENLSPINGNNLPSDLETSKVKNLSEMVESLTQMQDTLVKLEGKLSTLENLNADDEDDEDICLSKLKKCTDTDNIVCEPLDPILEKLKEMPSSPLPSSDNNTEKVNEPLLESNPAKVENNLNIENAASAETINAEEIVTKNIDLGESLLVEDVSKRPQRRKAKTTLKYRNDDDSDEDPFANVELSDDDEPRRGKKSGRYQSDDEYVPGLERGRKSSIDSSDSAAGDTLEELKKQTKKRARKKKNIESDHSTPTKMVKTNSYEEKKEPWRFSPDITAQNVSDDSLESSQSLVQNQKATQPSNAWGTSNEFENFLAKKIQGTNLKIKKVKPTQASPNTIAPLKIPVLDNLKKSIDGEAQTNIIHTASTSSQTTGPGTLSMKINKPLNGTQSEKACEFLKSIVTTTSELGQLMTQKSDDFIQKKINTENVVDTFKMDYCVKKSFLLLKLAKHNIMQMEEDLSSQYEKFLKDNDLLQFREQEKKIVPKPKEPESDSDCEIIEETTSTPAKQNESKPKFNLKTVFLNKELSIKIAKKPTEEAKPSNKKLNINSRQHTVWINDSIMVKKVKSQQSFLAQDSRNKKPPDNKITSKMVSDFFEDYYHKKAVQICAPFVSVEWICPQKTYVCGYFSVEPDKLTSGNISRTEEIFTNTENNITVSDSDNELSEKTICEVNNVRSPNTLFSICLKNLQGCVFVLEPTEGIHFSELQDTGFKAENRYQPMTLFSLCLEHLTKTESSSSQRDNMTINNKQSSTLHEDCLFTNQIEEVVPHQDSKCFSYNQKLKTQKDISLLSHKEMSQKNQIPSLITLCHQRVSVLYCANDTGIINTIPQVIKLPDEQNNPGSIFERGTPFIKSLSSCTLNKINKCLSHNQKQKLQKDISLLSHNQMSQRAPSLITLCHHKVSELFCANDMGIINTTPQVIKLPDEQNNPEIIVERGTPLIKSPSGCTLNKIKSLFTLCVEMIQCCQEILIPCKNSDFYTAVKCIPCVPMSLKQMALEYVKCLLNNNSYSFSDNNVDFTTKDQNTSYYNVKKLAELSFDILSKFYKDTESNNLGNRDTMPEVELTINTINTLSEEAFLNIEESNDQNSDYYEDEDNMYEDELLQPDTNNIEELDNNLYVDEVLQSETNNGDEASNGIGNENWVTQVQLEELISCVVPKKSKEKLKGVVDNEESDMTTEAYPLIAHIKTEPGLEELPGSCDNFISVVKTEPNHDLDQMTIIPESVITKRECLENVDPLPTEREPIQRQNSTSYDENSFEAFVSTNKMICAMDNFESNNGETFSQSALRVRRQHEPDSDTENDTSMSLLVPQTFEPLTIETAKGSLLENSSSDGENSAKKNTKRKPLTKRKQKKNETVKPNTKEVTSKDKHNPILAMLTRRMREKIRQEEKKVKSSDSDSESIPQFPKDTKNSGNNNSIRTPVKKNKTHGREIQCNNVDSTEKVDVPASNSNSELQPNTKEANNFTGFSAVDQNEISTYHKYVKYVYEQIIPKVNEESGVNNTKETSFNKITLDNQETSEKKEISNEENLLHKKDTSEKEKALDKTELEKITISDKKEVLDKKNILNKKETPDKKEIPDEKAGKKTGKKGKSLNKDVSENKEVLNNEDEIIANHEETGQLICPDEPIELLECTPTISMFDDIIKPKKKTLNADTKSPSKKQSEGGQPETKENISMFDDIIKPKKKTLNADTKSPSKKQSEGGQLETKENIKQVHEAIKQDDFEKRNEKKMLETFTERYGWKCYPIDSNDTKIYEQVIIPLEKLPESFVETYFEYQGITKIKNDDAEIDRLTNLQSLNRFSSVSKIKSKIKCSSDDQAKLVQKSTERQLPLTDTAEYNELTPSEDEDADYDDTGPTTVTGDSSENRLAKNCLMVDEDDSDSALSNKKTPLLGTDKFSPDKKKPKIGPKSKLVEVKHEHPDSLMLTADKMMNKELTLLHLPVVLDDKNAATPVKGPVTRNKQRSATKNYNKLDRNKSDDSSSEEEKQWVNTKEKLLKRLGRKQESAMEDDAKRAKLVSEFIEKRNDKPEVRKTRGPSKRSRRKLLERQKQMRVLSHELLGDASTHIGKGNSQSYFKGRRNIRKVIDKKSLARSTVIANMEEFERKRRLSLKQVKLQELMGCDEGVNVLVINDEVCLEYDFEQLRPAVTVHPFFTKVMKAHQYEGVKFMWDACFESLQMVQTGHPGGGCILAHCMGLGKTLQVLALLHTVLTHPRVGMHRILVCCPLSTVLNWVDEIHKWIGPVTDEIKVFELSKLKKTYERAYQLEDWYNGGGIFIIGYELFRSLTTLDAELDDIRQTIIDKIRTALLDPGPDIVICDEGHLLKNDSSVLAVAMSRVATRRRIVLTGTPMQNNLREYYCMVNFVKPNLLGTYAEYSNRFENPIMNGQHRDSQVEDIRLMKARTHILHKVLEGCLQRQEVSVLYPYLPKKHEYTVFISLTKCQCELYKHYLECYANKQKQSILKDFHTLQKIWSHPQVLHNFQMKSRDEKAKVKAEKLEDDLAREDLTATEDMKPAEDTKPSDTEVWWLQHLDGGKMLDCLESSNKFVAVFRILQEAVSLDDKVLIFSTSLITMDALEYFLKKINNWRLGQEYYRLDGSVPPEVRQKWCREFNAENNYKTKLFLISTRAGSLGLNMTAANRVIILDTSWNPAHDIQSIFRVYRFGQKKDCYIYRLVALGTMEQKIYERAVTKQAVSCRVVDEQQIDRHYNMAELTELYRFDETGVGVAGGVAVGVQDVVLLRVARDSALHAVHEHDSLLRGSEPALPEHERAAAWQQFQQETQRDQMKNENAIKKEKKIAKRNLSIDKTSTVTEIKDEPTEEANPAEPKAKRGKKVINCSIPIQPTIQLAPEPSTSKQPDQYLIDKEQENDMVKKITKILLSHDFNSKKWTRDTTKLIGTVRQVVANGDLSKLPPGDALAASIAQVLLRKEPSQESLPPMPALTNVRLIEEPVDIHTVPAQEEPEKEIEDHSFSDSVTETITGDLTASVKTRRRAAVTAEKKLDSIASDIVIDLNDDDWPGANVPSRPQDPAKQKYKPGPKSKKTSKPKQKPAEPILLSDDDTDDIAVLPIASVKEEPGSSNKESCEKKYPLPPSLLSNPYFVKILAHTYLAGNPTLDEDAATLAARYSCSKALREAELTGRPIDSGPIYDVALKVLGMEVLEKLHTDGSISLSAVSPSKSTESSVLKQNLISDTEKMLSDVTDNEDRPMLKVKVTSDLMPKEKPKPKIPNLGFVKLTPVAPQPVVPVGLIKRAIPVASNEPQSGDECILPDDDVYIVSPPARPAPPLAPAPAPAAPAVPRAAPLILNSVLSDTRPPLESRVPIGAAAPAPADRPVLTISAGKVVGAADAGPICLDSDDEDAAPALPEPAPPRPAPPQPAPPRPAPPQPALPRLAPRSLSDQKPNILRQPKASNLKTRPDPARPEPKLAPKQSTPKLCKPGDIIRITRTGEVEVLNKVDILEAPPALQALKLPAPAPAPAPAPPAPRSPDPADPLAILRDVVHIPAARYQAPPDIPAPKPPKKTETFTPQKPTQTYTPQKPTQLVVKEAKKPAPPAKEPSRKGSLLSRLTKNPRIFLGSVDLTDAPECAAVEAKPKPSTAAKTSAPKETPKTTIPKNIVVTGSSKSIFLTPSNTLKGGVVRVTNPEPRAESKKRPAIELEPEAPKRQKTERPMTLKDFDIDDIDDIIELE